MITLLSHRNIKYFISSQERALKELLKQHRANKAFSGDAPRDPIGVYNPNKTHVDEGEEGWGRNRGQEVGVRVGGGACSAELVFFRPPLAPSRPSKAQTPHTPAEPPTPSAITTH